MRNARLFLSTASAAIVVAGGLSLFTAAPAHAAMRACSSGQVTYVQGVIGDVCGSSGGTAIVVCDGANVSFNSISCN